ncbi:MAG: hypothetical protein LQ352_004422 [Teloschistes flavicans]|nr:MAG: hypothetical protein LQ352_004422 [Teloschistes flavicans]
MYDGVSVVGFKCRIGTRVLKGLVKERSQAKATYDAAVSRGETAGLLEQLPQASDVFSTRLGNIPAKKNVLVEITYVGELKHDAEADGTRFTLPTHIAPRYGSQPNVSLTGESRVQEDGGISITVDISIAEDSFIRGVQSPSHPIAVTMGNTSTTTGQDPSMHQASSTLSLGSSELEKDFVLIVLTKDTGTPKALLEIHDTIKQQQAMLVTLVPRFSLPPSHPEVVFVADRSGSMSGQIPTLVSALKVFLKSLPVGVKFNICSFGSTSSFLWPKSQAYSRDSVNEALAHVDSFGADYGGTETFDALKKTIDNRYGDIPCEVMLLTDGDIWNQNKLFNYLNEEVRKSESKLRIFALGIGNGVSHALIEGVARAGNGFAQQVNTGEKLDSKVIRMLKGGLSPHTTDYSLEVKYQDPDEDFELVEKVTDALKVMLSDKPEDKQENKPMSFFSPSLGKSGPEKPPSADNESKDPFAHLPEISVPNIIQTPQDIPPLFSFSRTSVYLLFSGEPAKRTPKSVTLRAKSEHGPLELEIPVETLDTPGQTIHQLAARKATQELEEGRGWVYEAKDDSAKLLRDRYPSRFDEIVQREAVRIGVQFQVGGKFSSFVAVNDKDSRASKELLSDDSTMILTPETGASEGYEIESNIYYSEEEDEDEDMGFGLFDDGSTPSGGYPSSMPPQPGANISFGGVLQAGSYPSPGVYGRSSASMSISGGGRGMIQTPASLQTQSRGPEGFGYSRYSTGAASDAGSRSRPAPASLQTQSFRPEGFEYSRYSTGAASVAGSRSRYPAEADTERSVPSRVTAHGSRTSGPPAKKLMRLAGGGGGPAPGRVAQTGNEKVHAVIDMQDFEGWWAYSKDLVEMMGLGGKVRGPKPNEWFTALVVKWLEVKMRSEKEVWELVVDKAKMWLVGQRVDVESLEKELMQHLQ